MGQLPAWAGAALFSSSLPVTESRTMSLPQPAAERLLSLDAFRGAVVLFMIWVNYIAEMPGIPHLLAPTEN